jgi:hypothetical protein
LYFGVGMTYIQFYIFGGGLENYSLPGFFETSVIILAIMNVSGAVVGWLVAKFAKNDFSISKVI